MELKEKLKEQYEKEKEELERKVRLSSHLWGQNNNWGSHTFASV